jgi:diguanylate cyclase (GGDEF)-like protein
MDSVAARTVFAFFVPAGLFFMAVSAILHMGLLEELLATLAPIYLYAVALAGVVLGWRFNQSRLVFAVIVVTLADTALVHFAAGNAVSPEVGPTAYNAVALLLPLNLAVLSMVKERGILTLRGIWRLMLIALQIGAVVMVCKYRQLDIAAYLEYAFIEAHFFTRIPLAQPALLAFATAFLVLTVRFIKRRGVIESGFFWGLVSVLFALAVGRVQPLSTAYFATAGFVLVISVVERSFSMAFRDELTGLPARRALDEALLRLRSTYSVAMLDIDFFKKFNDKYGHDVGDQVLRMVGSKLAKATGGGKPFRYGGEEFVLIFPGKLVDETIPYLERLRKAIEESGFILRGTDRRRNKPDNPKSIRGSGRKTTITVSIGVAERNERRVSPQRVINAADKALYRAKKAGRNRVKA